MVEFRCRNRECIECCTNPDMQIYVTLPDLYRACVYARKAESRDLTIPQAFDDICDGWGYLPDPEDADWLLPIPIAKVPCVYADQKRKVCTIHDTHQYFACRQYPESKLLPPTLFRDGPRDEAFWKSLACMQNVALTPERDEEIKNLCDAATREIKLTGNLLHNRLQPISAGSKAGFEAELKRRLAWCGKPKILGQLVQNMRANRMQERYMELMGIGEPDYTMDLSGMADMPLARALTPFYAIVKNMRPGRNESCPCGSGMKFKRCCGRC